MKVKSLAVAAAAAATLSAVPSAAAAPNPYTPKEICGASFTVLSSVRLPQLKHPNRTAARTYVMYSAATGENCVTTIKRSAVGRATYVSAGLRISGRAGRGDAGDFRYYAGPVKVHAPGRCIDWSGSFNLGPHNSGGFERVREFCR